MKQKKNLLEFLALRHRIRKNGFEPILCQSLFEIADEAYNKQEESKEFSSFCY